MKKLKTGCAFLLVAALVLMVGCSSENKSHNKESAKRKKATATASILVTNGAVTNTITDANGKTTDKISGSDISASLLLTPSIVDMLNTYNNYEAVAKQIEKDINKKYTAEELMDMSTVTRKSEDSLFIDITFTCGDAEEAIDLVNAFVDVACESIPNIFPDAQVDVVSRAGSESE